MGNASLTHICFRSLPAYSTVFHTIIKLLPDVETTSLSPDSKPISLGRWWLERLHAPKLQNSLWNRSSSCHYWHLSAKLLYSEQLVCFICLAAELWPSLTILKAHDKSHVAHENLLVVQCIFIWYVNFSFKDYLLSSEHHCIHNKRLCLF